MHIRRLASSILAAVLITTLAGCWNGDNDPRAADAGTPTSTTKVSEHDKMMTYINSSARNNRLNAAVESAGPIIAKAIFSGQLGATDKRDGFGEPLASTYIGEGGIYVIDEKSEWSAFATVYWNKGVIDYDKGIPRFSLAAPSGAGNVWITRSGFGTVNGTPAAADAFFRKSNDARMWCIDYTNLQPAGTDVYVNTYADAVKLDNKALEILERNMHILTGN